jgi:DNA repair exonuclease SbcCD nuclease subunit
MKIAILSDLHLGYDRFGEDAYTQARSALELACESADAVLIPGDIFDKRNPKPETIAQAINMFREAARRKWRAKVSSFKSVDGRNAFTDAPIIAIPGTHERTSEGSENALSLLGLAGLLVDAGEADVIIDDGKEKIHVFGLGGLSEERVRESLQKLQPKPVSDAFNIFMFHQSTYELLPFSDDFIHNEELPKGFDLYVDGHIHSRQELQVHGKKLLIPGSTVLTQLKEGEQEPKGIIVFDTREQSYSFMKINSRRFVCKAIEAEGAKPAELMEACDKTIKELLSDGGSGADRPIIRIVLRGKLTKGFTNTDMDARRISSKYSGKCFLEIDTSKLRSDDSEKSIADIRDSKMDGVSIKEAGINAFIENLKQHGFDNTIDAKKLFEILSSQSKKEKMMKEANELLLGQ